LDSAEADTLAARARQEVDAAFEFARNSPYPEPEEALQHVFV
jgi:TPP-dependent pyruvate/acetoin dehydrogenase alpha subunit